MTQLTDFYFHDPRVVLIPVEQLRPEGMSAEFAAAVHARGWEAARVALFNAGFARYWRRASDLAHRVRGWPAPRLRHVAVVAEPLTVHPYAALLNTSAWTLYACDLDPAVSHPELIAWLLAHGDRLMVLGEVTHAVLHDAPWWLERDDTECAAFARAAARSTRPDAAALRCLADALPWLRRLGHADLCPCLGAHRTIPGTAVQVPREVESEPPALVEAWREAAHGAVAAYSARWRAADPGAARALLDWLAAEVPPLLVAARGRVVWDPATPDRIGALRHELTRCTGAALRDIAADLRVVAAHTRRFLAAVVDPDALPPATEAEQRGYVYMHRERGLLVYNLDEPGIDRREGPALPYARAMLGARAVHEWAHRAVDAGWVPWTLPPAAHAARSAALAAGFDAAIAAAPAALRAEAVDGATLVRLIAARMPDFQCNLLACHFLNAAERETYVRHNVRTLRGELPPARRWQMLARYLYELQYLRFSAVADPRRFLLASTWADADLIASGLVTRARFDELADAVAALCDGYAVDVAKVRPA